jgi:hypothetical protein
VNISRRLVAASVEKVLCRASAYVGVVSPYRRYGFAALGDTILPQLKGKIEKTVLLRTGEPVEQIDHWGFELLKPDEQRIRTRAIRPGDVVKIELKK